MLERIARKISSICLAVEDRGLLPIPLPKISRRHIIHLFKHSRKLGSRSKACFSGDFAKWQVRADKHLMNLGEADVVQVLEEGCTRGRMEKAAEVVLA